MTATDTRLGSSPGSTETESHAVPLRLLLIDDESSQARLFERMLSSAYPGAFEISSALTLGEGLEVLEESAFDCVLLDHRLPDGYGVVSIDKVHAVADGIPVVILTGMRDPELEFAALAGGAQDYLAKDDLSAPMIRKAVLYAIERVRLQNGLMTAQEDQLNVQRQFFAHVSHELRTPVAAMYLSATNLGDGLLGKVSADQREAVEVIADNVQQLKRLVDDLLDATRMSEGKVPITLSRVDLGSLATAASKRHLTKDGVNAGVTVTIREDCSSVLADRQRVVQILDNLLSNARKYAPGASVEIKVSMDSAGERVVATVADSGPGIDEKDRERVFERMTQLDHRDHHARRGLGLGLYISRDLAHRMNGELWVSETHGGGASFNLELPAHPVDRLLQPVLAGRRSTKPIDLVRIDLDVFANHQILADTELGHELMDHVHSTLETLRPPLAIIRRSGTVLRCIGLGSDPDPVVKQIADRLDEVGTLADAGITPTRAVEIVPGTKSRRRTVTQRIDEMADAVLA